MTMFQGGRLAMRTLEEHGSGQVSFPQSWQASASVMGRHAVALVLASVAALSLTVLPAAAADMAAAELVNTDGKAIGQVTFEQAPGGVLLFVKVTGLPPGPHGIHLHSVGRCAPDFKAAKGHINPDKRAHGLRNPDGPDNGDLPNLYVAADGTGAAEFYTTLVSVADGKRAPALLDADGSAVIIHANPDDHMTQPIGGAGGRIACGVVKRKAAAAK